VYCEDSHYNYFAFLFRFPGSPLGIGVWSSMPPGPPDAPQVDPVQHHRQFAGPQFHRLLPAVDPGQLEGSLLQALVPQGIAVLVPVENLEPVTSPAAKEEQVTTERILSGDGTGALGQAVECQESLKTRHE